MVSLILILALLQARKVPTLWDGIGTCKDLEAKDSSSLVTVHFLYSVFIPTGHNTDVVLILGICI